MFYLVFQVYNFGFYQLKTSKKKTQLTRDGQSAKHRENENDPADEDNVWKSHFLMLNSEKANELLCSREPH